MPLISTKIRRLFSCHFHINAHNEIMETRELFLAENVLFYSWGVLVSVKGRREFVLDVRY